MASKNLFSIHSIYPTFCSLYTHGLLLFEVCPVISRAQAFFLLSSYQNLQLNFSSGLLQVSNGSCLRTFSRLASSILTISEFLWADSHHFVSCVSLITRLKISVNLSPSTRMPRPLACVALVVLESCPRIMRQLTPGISAPATNSLLLFTTPLSALANSSSVVLFFFFDSLPLTTPPIPIASAIFILFEKVMIFAFCRASIIFRASSIFFEWLFRNAFFCCIACIAPIAWSVTVFSISLYCAGLVHRAFANSCLNINPSRPFIFIISWKSNEKNSKCCVHFLCISSYSLRLSTSMRTSYSTQSATQWLAMTSDIVISSHTGQ